MANYTEGAPGKASQKGNSAGQTQLLLGTDRQSARVWQFHGPFLGHRLAKIIPAKCVQRPPCPSDRSLS